MTATAPAPRTAIRRMRPYHPPVEGRQAGVRLDFNERTTDAPDAAVRALRRVPASRLAMYPEYAASTRALAEFFGVSAREIVLTNGTDDALHLIVDTFCDAGDRVLVMDPSYAMYRFYAERAGARVAGVKYGRDFAFPAERLVRALRTRPAPRILFLANPNTPTGTLASKDEIRELLEAAPRTVIVVDEAYAEFSGVSVLDWIRRYRNLAVTRTFSKAQGLAGLRIGAILAGRELTAALSRCHSPYSVGSAGLAAAVAAAEDQAPVVHYAAEVRAARNELEAALDRLGIRRFPSGGNFVLVDVGPRAAALVAALKRRGILVRDRRADFRRPGFVRITVGTRLQTRNLIRALERLWRAR